MPLVKLTIKTKGYPVNTKEIKCLGFCLLASIFAGTVFLAFSLSWWFWVLAGIQLIAHLLALKSVPNECRMVTEVFGERHRITGPGLHYILPVVEKVRDIVPINVVNVKLLASGKEKVDFKDGSRGKPTDMDAQVKCLDPSEDEMIFKMVYGAKNRDETIRVILQNAVKSHLGSLTAQEAIELPEIPDHVMNLINNRLKDYGLMCLVIVVGDFDFDDDTLKARRLVLTADRAKEAASRQADIRYNQTMAVTIRMLAKALGKTEKQVQAFLAEPENRPLLERLMEEGHEIHADLVAAEGGNLFRGRGPGDMNLVALMQSTMSKGPVAKTDKDEGGKERKKRGERITPERLRDDIEGLRDRLDEK